MGDVPIFLLGVYLLARIHLEPMVFLLHASLVELGESLVEEWYKMDNILCCLWHE